MRYLLAAPLYVFGALWIYSCVAGSPAMYASFFAAGVLAAAIILTISCHDYRAKLTARMRSEAMRLRSDADRQHAAWLEGASIGVYGRWTPVTERTGYEEFNPRWTISEGSWRL